MKRLILLLGILLCASFIFSQVTFSPSWVINHLGKKGSITPGTLTYRISLFGVIPLGDAVFARESSQAYEGRLALKLVTTAKSLKVIEPALKGEVVFESFIDPLRYLPFRFAQKIIVKGKKDVDRVAFYDQNQGVMTIAGERRQIPFGTHDPLSAIFTIRKMDLDTVTSIELNLNTNQKNYVLEGTVDNKEIKIGGKNLRFAIVKAGIRRKDKNPYHRSKITMVLLKDQENIPILIRVFASGAVIKAKLTNIGE
ncbi:MAG: DUF3108 domain-containing protein [Candidatus Omnitrophica bacterium]|nr:DUF3108 domain-containing protein [Candidatus Omnitrophota bacterium]